MAFRLSPTDLQWIAILVLLLYCLYLSTSAAATQEGLRALRRSLLGARSPTRRQMGVGLTQLSHASIERDDPALAAAWAREFGSGPGTLVVVDPAVEVCWEVAEQLSLLWRKPGSRWTDAPIIIALRATPSEAQMFAKRTGIGHGKTVVITPESKTLSFLGVASRYALPAAIVVDRFRVVGLAQILDASHLRQLEKDVLGGRPTARTGDRTD